MTVGSLSNRQREILDSLSEIIVVEGFANLTVADLADRLRCSRRTLYTLATSREMLLFGVVEQLFSTWSERSRAAADAGGGGIESVVAFLISNLTAGDARPAFFDDVLAHAECADAYHRYRARHLEELRRLVDDVCEQGSSVCDPSIVSEVLDAVVERLRGIRRSTEASIDVLEATATIDELVRRWLQTPALVE